MNKPITILLVCLLFTGFVQGQQTPYEWRIGVSGGYTNYYGDLSPHTVRGLSNWDAIHHLFYYNEHYVDRVSFKISAEKRLSPSIGLMLSYGQYTFAMSDRYIQRDGTLMLGAPNFDRALNFQNRTRDFGIALVFKPDNDILLPSNSFIAPYFTLGGGYLDFNVRGDLLDNEGNPYDYAAGNVVNNRIYETELPPLRTERPDGYSTGAFYANFGLGIRFRLGPRVELFVQSDFIHAFTDYLDDVSGTYRESYDNAFQAYAAQPGTNVVDAENPQRGNPNSPNDWIIYHGAGLRFNLGVSKRAFSAPRLSTFYPDYTYTATRTTPRPDPEEREDEEERTAPAPTNITNIQLGGPDRRTDSLVYKSQQMNWDQQILSRENRILSGRLEQQRLRQRQEELDRQMEDLRRDTLVTQAERDSLRELREENRIDLRYSLDSIQRREGELETEIDSLKRLKDEYKFERTDAGWDAGDFYWDPAGMALARPFADRSAAPDTVAQAPEDAPTPPVAQEVPDRLEERIKRLEEENLRLQAEQEALRALPRENIYLPPSDPPAGYREMSPRERAEIRRAEAEARRAEAEARGARRPPINIFRGRTQREEPTPAQPEPRVLDGRDVERLMIGREIANIAGASLFGYTLPSPIPITPPPTEEPEPTDLEPTDPATEETAAEPDTEPEAPELRLLKSKTEVYFDINETIPSEEEALKLLPMVEFVKENEEFVLSLRGYADNTGNVAYNLKLIESRIEAVSEILTVRHGLSPDQIQTEIGGQIVRGAARSSDERDRKVEARILRRE